MKTLLVLVVAVGFPFVALAQPVADDGKSTEVSELIILARRATAASDLLVNGRCPVPPNSHWPNEMFDPPAASKVKRTRESAGTRAFVLREIAGIRNNTNDYASMGVMLAKDALRQLPTTRLWIACHGVFEGIKFLHVSRRGYDDFEVDFSNGALEWEVAPFEGRPVTEQSAIRYFFPQPATQRLEALLDSLQRGRPDYAGLAPDVASTLQVQWPALQKSLKDWGRWTSIYFVRQGDDGSYTFRVGYKRRQVVWVVGPFDAAGKLTDLEYIEAPS